MAMNSQTAYHLVPIIRKAKKSPADECVKLLKKYITDYDKSKVKEHFAMLLPNLKMQN